MDSPKQAKFRAWVRKKLYAGIIPTPSACLLFLGKDTDFRYQSGGPSMSGYYTKIRREEFAKAGLIQDAPGKRWRWPAE
jgi:hypothetical protein